MKKLVSIELQKIWKNKPSRVLTITYFVLLTSIALLATIKFNFGPFQFHLAKMGIFNFPFIWHFNTYVAAIFKLFFAVVIASMIGNEYSYGTLKQNLIDGLSKKEFLQSKFLTVIGFALISTVFVFIFSIILGLFFSDFNEIEIIFTEVDYLLAYFIKLVGFFSFCLFTAIWVKKSAFALGFLMLWNIIEGIVFLILLAIYGETKMNTIDKIHNFLPFESMSNLILNPAMRLDAVKTVTTQIGVENNINYAVNYFNILLVLAWTSFFMFLSYKIMKNRDL